MSPPRQGHALEGEAGTQAIAREPFEGLVVVLMDSDIGVKREAADERGERLRVGEGAGSA